MAKTAGDLTQRIASLVPRSRRSGKAGFAWSRRLSALPPGPIAA
jgi:hypothetical protein